MLDLQLRYRPVTEIDQARFGLWTRQLRFDLAAGEPGAVAGDATTLRLIRDRFVHTLNPATTRSLDAALAALRRAAADEDLAAASHAADRLAKIDLGST